MTILPGRMAEIEEKLAKDVEERAVQSQNDLYNLLLHYLYNMLTCDYLNTIPRFDLTIRLNDLGSFDPEGIYLEINLYDAVIHKYALTMPDVIYAGDQQVLEELFWRYERIELTFKNGDLPYPLTATGINPDAINILCSKRDAELRAQQEHDEEVLRNHEAELMAQELLEKQIQEQQHVLQDISPEEKAMYEKLGKKTLVE